MPGSSEWVTIKEKSPIKLNPPPKRKKEHIKPQSIFKKSSTAIIKNKLNDILGFLNEKI